MILSHLSGIRHYEKDAKKVKEDKEKAKRLLKPPGKEKEKEDENKEKPTAEQNSKDKDAAQAKTKKEFEHQEYYLKDNFESVTQALDLFKDDPLIFKPGKGSRSYDPAPQSVSGQVCLYFSLNYAQAPLFCTPLTPSPCSAP